MLPLQSFICPITKDVMRDPVQIASGQTYERAAIERWFEEGHTRCPTGVELKNTKMKPNFALKQSIAEWRERNYNIRLENANELLNNSEDDEEEQEKAVQDLQALCEEDSLNKYKVASKNLIPRLVKLTKSSSKLAVKAFPALAILAKDNCENQGIMVEAGIIDLIVRCLARQKEEAPQAVHLMRLLSENQDIAEKISHSRNAVLFLVTLIHEEEFAENVGAILENLPKSDNDVITMAEANIMKPLVLRLVEGEYESQILMAKTLGRLHMPDRSKEIVATTETISTLIEMMNSENHEGCRAAINALESLSSVPSISTIIEKIGGIQILVKQLNSAKSSETMKTGAAHVLANIFKVTVDDYAGKVDMEAELEELISMFLSLMGPITAPDIHYYILQGMIGLANGNKISITAKTKMKENNAFKLLINLWKTRTDQRVKERAVELFSFLSITFGNDACSALKEQRGSLDFILEMLTEKYNESDHAVAASILADLPPEDNQILAFLLQSNVMPQLVKFLENVNDLVVEASAGALIRFCMKKEHQPKLAEMNVIQKLVNLLSAGRSLTKERAAKALYYFSKSTPSLSKIPDPPSCFSCFSPRLIVCKLHRGVCSIEGTYCLLEAGAVKPLIQVLKEQKRSCVLAALNTLTTLIDDEVGESETGCRLIAEENGIMAVIGLISSGTPEIQEICANLCEKFFSMAEYRNKYGSAAQMHIISLAQKGSSTQRQTAGRILRQLELLHSQSHYFAVSTAGNS
uniref:RING-type E3 ubiquitin transferase n=1 Tax=Araucaria cunninghamii TaxID=56994 RepID=A0A0D6R5Z6_ARACU